jgi:hypothetical protein
MCHTAAGLITAALPEVDNAESLLKIKNLVALFMQAMDVSHLCNVHVEGRLISLVDVEFLSYSVRQTSSHAFREICRFAQDQIQ